jgi:hypothetical protein
MEKPKNSKNINGKDENYFETNNEMINKILQNTFFILKYELSIGDLVQKECFAFFVYKYYIHPIILEKTIDESKDEIRKQGFEKLEQDKIDYGHQSEKIIREIANKDRNGKDKANFVVEGIVAEIINIDNLAFVLIKALMIYELDHIPLQNISFPELEDVRLKFQTLSIVASANDINLSNSLTEFERNLLGAN